MPCHGVTKYAFLVFHLIWFWWWADAENDRSSSFFLLPRNALKLTILPGSCTLCSSVVTAYYVLLVEVPDFSPAHHERSHIHTRSPSSCSPKIKREKDENRTLALHLSSTLLKWFIENSTCFFISSPFWRLGSIDPWIGILWGLIDLIDLIDSVYVHVVCKYCTLY